MIPGMVLTYLGGWILHWRTLAWISNVFIVVPSLSCVFIHESPSWLVWKGRTEEAKRALNWLHKYQAKPRNTVREAISENFRFISFCVSVGELRGPTVQPVAERAGGQEEGEDPQRPKSDNTRVHETDGV